MMRTADILDSVYRGIFDVDAFSDVLEWVSGEIKATSVLYLLPTTTSTPDTLMLSSLRREDWDLYPAYFWKHDPCIPHRFATPYDRVFTNLEYFDRDLIKSNEHINDFLRPYLRGRLVNALKLSQTENGIGLLAVGVPEANEDAASETISARLETIRPHIQRAVRLRQDWIRTDPLMKNAFDQLGLPTVIFDAGGRVRYVNTVGERFLRDHDGTVSFAGSQPGIRLGGDSMLLCAAKRMVEEGHRTSQFARADKTGCVCQFTVIRCTFLHAVDRLFETGEYFVSLVRRRGAEGDPGGLDHRETFGLTHTEAEIVRLLCQGLTIDTIARGTGRARNTVRNHLWSAMQKVGVNRQADLVRMLVT